MTSHQFFACALACAGCVLFCGCDSSGLSPGDAGGSGYPKYVLALAQETPSTAPASSLPLATPIKLAVAEFGEVAPPAAMMQMLQGDRAAFASLQGIPGPGDDERASATDYYYRQRPAPDPQTVRQSAQQMRTVARQLGADYLFAFGGTVDHAVTATPFSALDLTIIGAFIVPSKQVQAEAKAAGALIDLRTGQVLFTLSAEAQRQRITPTVSEEHDQLALIAQLRKQLAAELAGKLKDRVQQLSGSAPGAGG